MFPKELWPGDWVSSHPSVPSWQPSTIAEIFLIAPSISMVAVCALCVCTCVHVCVCAGVYMCGCICVHICP